MSAIRYRIGELPEWHSMRGANPPGTEPPEIARRCLHERHAFLIMGDPPTTGPYIWHTTVHLESGESFRFSVRMVPVIAEVLRIQQRAGEEPTAQREPDQ